MFFLKGRLRRAILAAAKNNIESYKTNIRLYINSPEDELTQEDTLNIRREYLDSCANDVFSVIGKISPRVAFEVQHILIHPEVCGYDVNIENGFLAGSTFAMCYYILTGKIAKPMDCVKLNHVHNAIMDKALKEI